MILALGLMLAGGLLIWQAITGMSGFAELGKLFRGETAFGV